MREILSDLVAESQFLDQFLQKIKIADWDRPTPAKGWTIRDQISHLADSSELAADAINGGSLIESYRSAPNLDVLRQAPIKKGRKMRPQDVIEWWRGGRAKVVEPLSHMQPDHRIDRAAPFAMEALEQFLTRRDSARDRLFQRPQVARLVTAIAVEPPAPPEPL